MFKLKQWWCWFATDHYNIVLAQKLRVQIERFYVNSEYIISEIRVKCCSCDAIVSKYLHHENEAPDNPQLVVDCFQDKTLVNSAAKLLIWLAENGYVDFKNEKM